MLDIFSLSHFGLLCDFYCKVCWFLYLTERKTKQKKEPESFFPTTKEEKKFPKLWMQMTPTAFSPCMCIKWPLTEYECLMFAFIVELVQCSPKEFSLSLAIEFTWKIDKYFNRNLTVNKYSFINIPLKWHCYQPPVVYMVYSIQISLYVNILITLNPITFPDYVIHCSSHVRSFSWSFHIIEEEEEGDAIESRAYPHRTLTKFLKNNELKYDNDNPFTQLMNMNESQWKLIQIFFVFCFSVWTNEWNRNIDSHTGCTLSNKVFFFFWDCVNKYMFKVKDYIIIFGPNVIYVIFYQQHHHRLSCSFVTQVHLVFVRFKYLLTENVFLK